MVVLKRINDDWMELIVDGTVRDQGHPPFTLDRLQRRLADHPDLKLAEIVIEDVVECYGCAERFTSTKALDREGLCVKCR